MARDPVAEAISAQMNGGYQADLWVSVDLEPMTKVWQGIGGKSDFFVGEENAREATGAYTGTQAYRFAETLWRHAQVQANPALGYRSGIREFVVDIRTLAAAGTCRENPLLGSGSVVQYYIPDWESRLHATGRQFTFDQAGFPKKLGP